jgi:hypothetical protein
MMGEYLPALLCILPGLILLAVLWAKAESRGQGGSHSGRLGELRIVRTGQDFVEFDHPEGGSWAYGMHADLSAVNGIRYTERIAPGRYRTYVDRNPVNAARVLQAAYDFRTSERSGGGTIYLNDRPGYQTLVDEELGNLD